MNLLGLPRDGELDGFFAECADCDWKTGFESVWFTTHELALAHEAHQDDAL